MVTVRTKALGDRRVARLAQLAQYPGGDDEALGKMTRLWALCAEQQTNTPEVRHIRACLGPCGEEHLVESGLGDDKHRDPSLGEGVIRVRGCDETDWYLARLEQQGQVEAGRARAALAERDAAGRFRPGPPPSSDGPASGSSLSGSSDLITDPSSLKLPESGESVSAERGRVEQMIAYGSAARVARRSHPELRSNLFGDAWRYAGLKHHELKAEGIDPHARNCWSHFPPAGSEEVRELQARIDELTEDDGTPAAERFKRAGNVIRNRVDVAVAEARRDKTLRWFIPVRMWGAKSFAIAKDLSPEQAAQPRQQSLKPAEQPVRRVKSL